MEHGADILLMLTDVDAAYRDWAGLSQEPIDKITAGELRPEEFPAGSMGPKIEAARDFVIQTGGSAVIGSLEDAIDIL
ncbi:hypothetical protein ASD31_23060 [Rhizobium sp. Root482]|nr:hypothetical protein ASD31_23060 [Rhizobium sp. Root482]